VSAEAPGLLNPGQLPEAIDHAYANVPVPPAGVAVIVTDWPWSMTIDVGEIVTVGVDFTVTAALVAGVAVAVGVAPPVVPASVMVTVRAHAPVAPDGV